MSTNSSITAKCKDGKFRSIYCHWDGDLYGVGYMLAKHFAEQAMIEELLDLGSISSLYPSIECPDGHTFDTPVEGHTIAYGRDRGEEDEGCLVCDTLGECVNYNQQEYNYFWDGKKWFVGKRLLTDALAEMPE